MKWPEKNLSIKSLFDSLQLQLDIWLFSYYCYSHFQYDSYKVERKELKTDTRNPSTSGKTLTLVWPKWRMLINGLQVCIV